MKDNERKRRKFKIPILLSDIANDTRLPKDMDSFWPSADNKIKLEILLRNWLKDYHTLQNIHGPVYLYRVSFYWYVPYSTRAIL